MKIILTGIAFLIGYFAFGQSYDDQLNKAAQALQKKDFCNALTIFQTAFKDSAKIGTYDLAYAASAAANCNSEKIALIWLRKSQQKGLGQSLDEIAFISNDSVFIKLRSYPEWIDIINDMKKAVLEKQELQAKKVVNWIAKIKSNKIAEKENQKFVKPKSGFALYYTTVDSLQVPYIVYIPKKYNTLKPMQTIVYLHGGIVSTENFNFDNPELATGEPIFSVGDTFNSIIIYPFGKKDFGWVAQKKAFENVLKIIKNVQQLYNIDKKRIFIGGMSNGGTATFWFASQKPNIFKGFYAFSALPKLEIDDINFKNLSQGKLFYSINSKEDDVFKYNDILSIYTIHKAESKDWVFETLDKGNHGFIYDPAKGKEIVNNLFKKLLTK
jgi:Prolyl oligopeptidase family